MELHHIYGPNVLLLPPLVQMYVEAHTLRTITKKIIKQHPKTVYNNKTTCLLLFFDCGELQAKPRVFPRVSGSLMNLWEFSQSLPSLTNQNLGGAPGKQTAK